MTISAATIAREIRLSTPKLTESKKRYCCVRIVQLVKEEEDEGGCATRAYLTRKMQGSLNSRGLDECLKELLQANILSEVELPSRTRRAKTYSLGEAMREEEMEY